MSPQIKFEQANSFSLYMLRAIINGRGQTVDITPGSFGDKFLHQKLCFQAVKRVNEAFSRLSGLRQHYSHPLRPLHQVDHQWRVHTIVIKSKSPVSSSDSAKPVIGRSMP